MLKIWIFAAIAVAVTAFPSNHTEDLSFQLYRGQSKFALALLKSLRKVFPRENLIFSPHSTYRTLLLVYMGASGHTKTALEKHLFLNWANDKNDIVDAYKIETIARAERFSCNSIQFNSVDKIYVTNDAQLKSHITDVFTSKQIETVDFTDPEARRAEINAFIQEATQNYIKDLLPLGSIQAYSKAVLANAAFFRGFWKTKFDKTELKHFNGESSIPVEMMHVRGHFRYGVLDGESARFIELPYESEDRSISMFIFLPIENSPVGVYQLIKKFTVETIHSAFTAENILRTEIDVEVPKMSLQSEYVLNDAFIKMGITELFDENADLSDFAENISLRFDDIVHKAVIEVSEEGTVAAAATAAPSIMSMPQDSINFHCDHPFVFMINDHITEEVLFTGIYRGPPLASI